MDIRIDNVSDRFRPILLLKKPKGKLSEFETVESNITLHAVALTTRGCRVRTTNSNRAIEPGRRKLSKFETIINELESIRIS